MLGMYQRYFPILFFAKVATVLPYVDHYNYEHMNFFFFCLALFSKNQMELLFLR